MNKYIKHGSNMQPMKTLNEESMKIPNENTNWKCKMRNNKSQKHHADINIWYHLKCDLDYFWSYRITILLSPRQRSCEGI